MRLTSLCCLVLFVWTQASPAQDQTPPQYWPLEVGNKWVYEVRSRSILTKNPPRRDPLTLEVVGQETVEGREFFRLNNGPLLRVDEQGNIIAFDADFDPSQPNEYLIFRRNAEGDYDQDTLGFPALSPREHVVFYFSDISEEMIFRAPFALVPPQSEYRSFRNTIRRVRTNLTETPVGIFTDGVYFAQSLFETSCGSTFAVGVGPVSGGCGSDQSGTSYWLMEANLNGRKLLPTAVPISSWGELKKSR